MQYILMAVVASVAVSVGARTVTSFNDGWQLTKDGRTVAVEVPHDWAIAGPFDAAGHADTGKLPWKGEGVYRRTLVLGEKPKGRFFLDFDGVMARATVFVNGNPCGKGEYGYLGFRADATAFLLAGTNTIEVKCDTKALSSRWYPGGGLYRDVRRVETDDVYVEDDSLRIETKDVLSGTAQLKVEGEVANRRTAEAKVRVTVRVKDAAGRIVAEEDEALDVDGFADESFELKLKVKNPTLWQMKPGAYLYALEVSLSGEGFSDTIVRRIGFREFAFDPAKGFFLNGRRVQLKGIDLHADLGPLGMAFDADAMRRQLEVMVDMGANALRTSHNCPAPQVLDICDELGIFVWDECFDKWNGTCGRGDEPMEPFVARQLAAWVRRDRLHPSVFCWSIGNEISPGQATPPGQEDWASSSNDGTSAERCGRFRYVVRAEDRTRPVCIGSCFGKRVVDRGDHAMLDLTGWNYGGQYSFMHERHPDKPVLYSESASALSEYGFYQDRLPTNKTDYATDSLCVDSYDLNAAPWSDIPDREFFRMEKDRHCCGEFVWTGIDYLGEPTPYAVSMVPSRKPEDAARSSYFGICDLLVMPKDRFYLYRSWWNESAFTLHIVPDHWTFPSKVGKQMPVFVYTSADEAELFVNGRSMGRRRKDRSVGTLDDYYSVLPRYRLMWRNVPYEAGEVKAVAYGPSGETLGTEVLRTAGEPTRVVLTPEKRIGSLCVVKVTLADRNGTPVPNDCRRISFAAEGCEIRAVGNADPHGLDSFKDVSSHPLRFGRAAVYLRLVPGRKSVLKATALGLADAVLDL